MAHDFPRVDDGALDPVEARIIERVGDLRRKGIDTYAENLKVYNARLARAAHARDEVELAASQARGDFLAAVAVWQARMAAPSARVTDAIASLRRFREDHAIGHVAREPNLLSWLFVAMLVLVIESTANAFLFSRAMSQGFAGGWLWRDLFPRLTSRLLVWRPIRPEPQSSPSALEVLRPHRCDLYRHRPLPGPQSGRCTLRGTCLEQGLGLEEALARSWETAWHTPLELRSFLSAVLMLLGIVASVVVPVSSIVKRNTAGG